MFCKSSKESNEKICYNNGENTKDQVDSICLEKEEEKENREE